MIFYKTINTCANFKYENIKVQWGIVGVIPHSIEAKSQLKFYFQLNCLYIIGFAILIRNQFLRFMYHVMVSTKMYFASQ